MKRSLASILLPRALSFMVLLLSIAGHFAALVLVRSRQMPAIFNNPSGVMVPVAVSLLLEAAVLLAGRPTAFRVLHYGRLIVLSLLVQAFAPASFAAVLVVVAPFLIETLLFERFLIAIPACILTMAMAGAVLYGSRSSVASMPTGEPVLVTVLAMAFVTWLSTLVVQYRETIVAKCEETRSLNGAIANLSRANTQLQVFAENLETETTERERNRITRELHDIIGYALTNVIIMMDAGKMLAQRNSDELPGMLERIRCQTEQALQETRQILHRLREMRSLRPHGLKAIAHLVSCFQEATSINVELHTGNLPWSLGSRLDSAILRLVQEGLTNAIRHGNADRIRILLWEADREIRVCLWDNGVKAGVAGPIREGIGLSGMRERFEALGGQIHPHFMPEGFQLDATIPFERGDLRG